MRLQQIASCFAALVFAALVPAFLVTIPFSLGASLDQIANLFLISVGIALAHALLALPLFLLLRELSWVNAFSAAAGGFAVAIIGGVLITIGQFNRGFSSSADGVPQVVNGAPTVAGWLSYFGSLAYLGLLGAIAGLVFWCVWKWSGGAASPDKDSPRITNNKGAKTGLGLGAAALVTMIAVFAFPAMTKDRTCHNKFREAGTIGPALVYIDLSIASDDWPKLVQLFREFGATKQLSFRNSGRDEFGARRELRLSLCNEVGANVEARQEAWAAGVGISVHQLRDGAGSRLLAKDLVENLEGTWPGTVRFRDARGQMTSRPPDG